MKKWIGERISFVDDQYKTTIVITPDANGWQISLIGAWFFMWMTIGGIMIWQLTQPLKDQEMIIIAVFLSFWVYYATRVGRQFFWLLWGREYLKINDAALTIKNGIRTYGKAVPYFLENIQKMRLNHPEKGSIQALWESSVWIRGGERIEFDYMKKVVRFGRKLNEKDSKILFQLITKRMDEQLRKKKHG